jgi:phosphoribosylformylglycinamidine synthase
MWQLSEAVDGIGDACRALGIPVIGGNVSLYNESRGRDIDPTPIVGVLGMVDRLERRPPGVRVVDGGTLVLLGSPSNQLAGSRWSWAHDNRGGELAVVDFAQHRAVCDLVRTLVNDNLLDGVHDIADGGLALTLAEMAVESACGFRVSEVDGHGELFGEASSRFVVCASGGLDEVLARARAASIQARVLGTAGGGRLVVDGLLDLPLADALAAWRDRLPTALGAGAAHD